MSFLSAAKHTNAIKSLTTSDSIIASSYRGLNGNLGGAGSAWYFQPDGHDIYFQYGSVNSSLIAYASCPPVTAIINRKAQAYINGKTWILNTIGKAKGKEATGEVATRIRNLMNRPNPLQSWKQFEAQNYIYQQLSGYCIALPIKPIGFDNTYATGLWNIPPWMLRIQEKTNANFLTAKSIKDLVESISVVYNGLDTPLPLDDIFIFKDFSPSVNSVVFPESRIRSLMQPINNILGIYESEGVLIDKRGPSIVVSSAKTDDSGEIALQPKEKKEIEDQFMERFGLLRGQARAIITSAPINVSTVGFTTKDLMLLEMAEDSIMRLCDSFGYPFPLIANNRTNSLGGNNTDPFKKILYQDSIIPEADSMYEQWSNFFSLDKYSLSMQKNFSHVAALQADQVQEAIARFNRNRGALIEFQNNLLKLNEWRDLNNDDPIEGELGNLYYYELIAKGIVFGQGVSGSSVPDTSGISAGDNGQATNGNGN